MRTLARFAGSFLMMSLLCSGAARAQVVTTDINLSSYSGNAKSGYISNYWEGEFPGSTSGNTGSGLTFANWNNSAIWVTNTTATISTGSTALSANPVVNALISIGTQTADTITVKFTNSTGATATFSLVSGQTVRDDNDISGTTEALSGVGTNVTAQEWTYRLWEGSVDAQLDAQTFTLPTSWAGTTLTNMKITVGSADTALLSALQVQSGTPLAGEDSETVPEPLSVSLFGIGFLGLAGVRRRLG